MHGFCKYTFVGKDRLVFQRWDYNVGVFSKEMQMSKTQGWKIGYTGHGTATQMAPLSTYTAAQAETGAAAEGLQLFCSLFSQN